ncbi:MAG: ATPase inhibitor subunit zeta [Microvirga sp.]
MTRVDHVTILRNMLLGKWAASELGLCGKDADAYANALCAGALNSECSDVFSTIRRDFDAAGVVQCDEQILRVMTELMLQAGNQLAGPRSTSPDAAAAMLARRFSSI